MSELKPINNGRQQSSYKEFVITLQPDQVYTLNNPFNFFRCLRSSANFDVAWSSNQMDTNFRQGRQAKFDDVLPYAVLHNPQVTAITVVVGVGIGDFDDNEFSVYGSIQVVQGQYDAFSAKTVAISSGKADVPVSAHTVIQNTSQNLMYIGGNGVDGLQLEPGATFEFSCAALVSIYGTNGDTLAIGSFN